MTLAGNGASMSLLSEPGIRNADLLVAATDSDEVNMIACMAAKQAGIRRTIARVRNQDYAGEAQSQLNTSLRIDLMINPEMVTAIEISRILLTPAALDVEDFAEGKVRMLEVKIHAESSLINIPLVHLQLPPQILIAGILRQGTRIGRHLAVLLENAGIAVKVIDKDHHRCQGENIVSALRAALFQVSSITTITGFASADFDKWPSLSKLILFLLMFIGGSAGSTAGGMKVSRIIILFQVGWAELKKAIHPKLVVNIKYSHKAIEPTVLHSVLIFFFLFILIFAVATLILAATGLEPFEAMSAVAATLGNVGPGLEITLHP
ncbi:hypothetical protein JCM15765_12130 [Paradesulfitobacterium aromaticivorans]